MIRIDIAIDTEIKARGWRLEARGYLETRS